MPEHKPSNQSTHNVAITRRLLAVAMDATWIGLLVWALGAALPISADTEDIQFWVAGILILTRDAMLPGGSFGKRLSGIILVNAQTAQPLGAGRAIMRQASLYAIVALVLIPAFLLSRATKGVSEQFAGAFLVALAVGHLTLPRSAGDYSVAARLVNRVDGTKGDQHK